MKNIPIVESYWDCEDDYTYVQVNIVEEENQDEEEFLTYEDMETLKVLLRETVIRWIKENK